MQQVKQSFNNAATRYDQAACVQKHVAHYLEDYMSKLILSPKQIIELGCGTGYFSKCVRLLYPNTNLIATDCAVNMLINSATQNNVNHIGCYSEQLPFVNCCCDLLVSNLMLQWCDVDNVFFECQRILKSNGHVIMTTLGPQTLHELKSGHQKLGISINQFLPLDDILSLANKYSFLTTYSQRRLFIDNKSSYLDILKGLKDIGSVSLAENKNSIGSLRRLLLQDHAQQHCETRLVSATYEVYLIHLTKL